MKITRVAGLRPNFIKIAPIIKAIENLETLFGEFVQNGSRKAGIPELWDGKASERIVEILLQK